MSQQAFISLRHNYFLLQCHKKQLNYCKSNGIEEDRIKMGYDFFW